jgi:hypothetical protein
LLLPVSTRPQQAVILELLLQLPKAAPTKTMLAPEKTAPAKAAPTKTMLTTEKTTKTKLTTEKTGMTTGKATKTMLKTEKTTKTMLTMLTTEKTGPTTEKPEKTERPMLAATTLATPVMMQCLQQAKCNTCRTALS